MNAQSALRARGERPRDRRTKLQRFSARNVTLAAACARAAAQPGWPLQGLLLRRLRPSGGSFAYPCIWAARTAQAHRSQVRLKERSMRKSISGAAAKTPSHAEQHWLDLESLASVEISSEDAAHPFENALAEGNGKEWRASAPGPQSIRLVFDTPQSVHQIRLVFQEQRRARSQEFAIYATSGSHERTELVRQQWSFSPDGSTLEAEQYAVNLPELTRLELEIDPGRHDGTAVASLAFIGLA